MVIVGWAMGYLYEYGSLLIYVEFLIDMLCAKLGTISIPLVYMMLQAAREISRRIVFDLRRALYTSPKIINKHIESQ